MAKSAAAAAKEAAANVEKAAWRGNQSEAAAALKEAKARAGDVEGVRGWKPAAP